MEGPLSEIASESARERKKERGTKVEKVGAEKTARSSVQYILMCDGRIIARCSTQHVGKLPRLRQL